MRNRTNKKIRLLMCNLHPKEGVPCCEHLLSSELFVDHECGTHHELLALRGEYHSMWNVQRDKHPLPTQSADA